MIAVCFINNPAVDEAVCLEGIVETTAYPDCHVDYKVNMNSVLGRAFIAAEPTMLRTTVLTLPFEYVFAVIRDCASDYIVTRLAGEKGE